MLIFIRKIDKFANNPEKSSAMKIGEHFTCGYSISTVWGFDPREDVHTLYQGIDCMKKLCISLREHAKNIINFEKKKLTPLTNKQLKSDEDATLVENIF